MTRVLVEYSLVPVAAYICQVPKLFLLLCAACLAAGSTRPARMDVRSKVVVLGSGNPNADPDRFGPALAVVVDDRAYLVDAGIGVVRRAAAAERNGIGALAPKRLTRAFITHLHSDHTLGLADLMLSPWVLDRDAPLHVYGPSGLRTMTDHLRDAYAEDVRIRTFGGEPRHSDEGRRVLVHELSVGVAYRDDLITITAFAVRHGAWSQAFGYKFQTPDRTIVISGDTGAESRIDVQCQRCDVLVHEVYSEAGLAKRPADWRAYHARYHTSSRQLAGIASRARPALLVLYHQLIWSSTEEDLVKEVRSAYDGKVVSAHDLDVF